MEQMLEEVQNGEFDPIKVFTGNKDKFLEVKTAIESISNNLPKDVCIKFMMTKIVPTVFDKTIDNTVRDEAVEIGLHFLQFVNVSLLDPKEQEDVFVTIEDKYIKLIGELRDSNYSNWDKLWIFLIKLCSEKLHLRMGLANKLLRILEVAFRNNTSIEQRLKAYDCWIEFINNSSLNMQHMCCAKQIKLLVTPLRAKFSRIPVVMVKRCDTFVYLLEKLQDKATLCLKEFLEFCFGPFDEKNNVEKMRQGRSVPEVCNKSTKVLLDLIGHSHDTQTNCLESDDLRLYKPLISIGNFPNFAETLINSVVECSVLLNEWSQNLSQNNTIIKCLWRSLLKLVQEGNEDVKKKCYIQINNALRKLLERSEHNEPLYSILGSIIDTLIKDEIIEKIKETVFDIGLNVLRHTPPDLCSFSTEDVANFLVACFDPENGSKFNKIASDYFKNGVKCESLVLCDIWLRCNFTLGPENVSILIWPVRQLKNFKDIEALNSKWTKLYSSETMKVVIIQEMEKLFHNNPLLGSNIVHFLELMSSAETNPGKDFVAKFMRLVELVLTLPNLPDSDKKKLSSIVITHCNQNRNFYKSENNDEAVDKLCGCLEHLVSIHKDYTVLTELASHLKNGQPKILLKFSKRLMSFLETLMLNEDNSVANNTRKLIELLEIKENEPEAISLTSSRSLRIVNMASGTPKSRKIVGQSNNMNLFGKSPLSLRSNKVASSPRSNTATPDKKKVTTVSINEEKSSDYVKIETEIIINPDNLSEHQKEVLKRRREDIPALYQDLTQSQSQDFFEKITKDEHKSDSPEKKQKKKSPSPSKKRKRNDDGANEHADNIRKASENFTSNNKLEELFETETMTNVTEIKVSESLVTENVKDVEVSTHETEETKDAAINGTHAEIKTEESEDSIKENTAQHEEQTSPRPKRKSSVTPSPPDKSVRKSKRQTKSLREELVNAVKKQLEQFRAEVKNEKQIEQDIKIEENNVEENINKDENGESVEKEDGKTEVTLRKSKRQVQKRNSDYVPQSARKSIFSTDSKNTNQETEKEGHGSSRKNKKQKPRSQEVIEVDESFEELLERVDRRIEERKRNEKLLAEKLDKNGESPLIRPTSDGNQNEIIPLEEDTGAQNVDLKDNKKSRSVAKAKRRILPSTASLPDVTTADTTDNQLSSVKIEDVYEFKAEDESVTSETKKRSKKKKRSSLPFNRSGYISKRRKKPKREKKEESFPFHVTADSPLPLSESPSLRTVPSQSETITIVITRSPLETSKEIESNPQVHDSEDVTSPAKQKSKLITEDNSEDVIESSQETPTDATRRRSGLSKSKSKAFKQTTIEEAMKPLLNTTPDSPRRRTRSSGPPEDDGNSLPLTETVAELPEAPTEKVTPLPLHKCRRRLSLNETSTQEVEMGRRNRRSISLDKLEYTTEITFPLEPLEIPHVKDTSADTLTCGSAEVDTQETAITDTEQLQLVDTLTLSSPVTTQTKEDLPGSPITCDTPDRTSELLNSTFDISPINSAQEDEVATPTPKQSTNEVSSLRVARLLQMVNSNVQVSNEGRRWFGNKHSSPSSSRVRKMRLKREENLDILTFSREVPSPLTLPASGILKRKLNAVDESPAPSPKRKRVNFSDPAITDKKLFIKDADEYLPTDQPCESTNDDLEDINDKKSEGFLSALGREDTFSFKDFCDSNFKDITLDSSKVKSVFKQLLQNLKVPELVEVISEFLSSSDSTTVEEICSALTDNGISTQVIDKCVLPTIQNCSVLEEFLPKFLDSIEKSSNEKLEHFVHEVARIAEEKRINKITPTELSQEQIKDHIVNLDCDKMNDLIRTYFTNLQGQKRNDFLVDLMNFASSELPVNKEFVNCHVNILQNFVKKMTD